MKHWVFAIVLAALWATVLAVFLTPGTPHDHGLKHPNFSAMDQGGDGLERHRGLVLPGCLFGCAMIALFVSLLIWGTVGSTTTHIRVCAFVLGGLLYEGVFALMCLAYWRSLTAVEVAFLGPFPAGLSWQLFGVWVVPSFFIVLYVAFFNRWIMPPESVQRFHELVQQTNKKSSGTATDSSF